MALVVVSNDVKIPLIQMFMMGGDCPEKASGSVQAESFPHIPYAVGFSYSLVKPEDSRGQMNAYSGEFDVEDGGFVLDADRLIVRDEEVAFMLSGSDKWGNFRIEGVARRTEQGTFFAPNLRLLYPQYASNDLASIQFDEVNQTAQKTRCHVRGVWKQYGDTWLFSGILGKKYEA